jgi:hypothetical protein
MMIDHSIPTIQTIISAQFVATPSTAHIHTPCFTIAILNQYHNANSLMAAVSVVV